jgi:hypothetical protein
MSDADTAAEIERHNVKVARILADYWRKRAVEIQLVRDPTKGVRLDLGPNGLPRGYRGEDAIHLKRG